MQQHGNKAEYFHSFFSYVNDCITCSLAFLSMLPSCSYLGSTGYPDFINPEMRELWVKMFAYDQYEVGVLLLKPLCISFTDVFLECNFSGFSLFFPGFHG